MFNVQKQMEELGLPMPLPPKEYTQVYKEALMRMIVTTIASIVTFVTHVNFYYGAGCWMAAYMVSVLLLYILKVPKEFSFMNEVMLSLKYFIAFFVIYIMIDNAVDCFDQ